MINKDIELHLGYRKCGKSEVVEKTLIQNNTKVYIGTLPRISVYRETIRTHIERRGNEWVTIDLNFNFEEDLCLINTTLSALPETSACMIDGIWTWYVFSNSIKQVSPEFFAHSLCELIKNNCYVWRIVDIANYVFDLNDRDRQIIEIIHDFLVKELDINKIIDYKYE